jgi:8-oxo-dGTP pyrophosphatase MutT (NUDIX family)
LTPASHTVLERYAPLMPRFLHLNTYVEGSLRTRWTPSTRRIVPEIEQAIDDAWRTTLARPGVHLFDGPVCRFEGMQTRDGVMTIDLSPTSYRIVVGTNFCNPNFADIYGPDVMANPVGVSTGLLTSDGFLMMGRRNARVAYYPNRVHPFAGSLEVEETIDLFANVRRELREELSLAADQIEKIVCLGLAEDGRLRHPETIYMAWTSLNHDQVARQVHADEHHAAWHVQNDPDAIRAALAGANELTPIARAVLLAHGRETFGVNWFDEHST